MARGVICELEFRGYQAPPLLFPSLSTGWGGSYSFRFILVTLPQIFLRGCFSAAWTRRGPLPLAEGGGVKGINPSQSLPRGANQPRRGAQRLRLAKWRGLLRQGWPLECTAEEGGDPSSEKFASVLVAVSRRQQQDADRAL